MDDFQHLDDHALLGVSPHASPDDIKQAYRREITKFHPDRFRNADQQTQQYARERSQRITEAYSNLSRRQRRSVSSAVGTAQPFFAQRAADASHLAAQYEQAMRALHDGRVHEAARLLREIQKVDPFYRDVDEQLARAEALAAPRRRKPIRLILGGAGALVLVLVLGLWSLGRGGSPELAEAPGAGLSVAPQASAAMASAAASSEAVIANGSIGGASAPAGGAVEGSSAPVPTELPTPSPVPPPTEAVPTAVPPTAVVPTPLPPTAVVPTPLPPTAAPPIAAPAPAAPTAAPRVALEGGRVLVADNFGDASSGWSELQAATYTLGYRDGAYAITTQPGTGSIFSYGAPLPQGEVVIGADVTPLRGSAGLLFGPENSYRFFISGDGRYRVESRGRAIVPATANRAVRSGTNRLVIAAAGQRVSLYINGTLVTNLDLPSSLRGTTYGFVVAPGQNGGEALFDSLTVRSLPR